MMLFIGILFLALAVYILVKGRLPFSNGYEGTHNNRKYTIINAIYILCIGFLLILQHVTGYSIIYLGIGIVLTLAPFYYLLARLSAL